MNMPSILMCARAVLVHLFNASKFGCFSAGSAFVVECRDKHTCRSPSVREGKFYYKEPFFLFWQRSSCGCILLGSVGLMFTTGSTVESGILL